MKQRIKPEELRSLQAPIKEKYRSQPIAALVTLQAEARISEGLTCKLETGRALVEAGLHPATGGDGLSACSGDMLLEALVACAGVTLRAVATALAINLRDAKIRAEGDLDFRGTLGVSKDGPRGVSTNPIAIRFGYRRQRRTAGYPPSSDGTLLRCLSDAKSVPKDRHCAPRNITVITPGGGSLPVRQRR